MERLEALDGMRGVAALIVATVHCSLVLGSSRTAFPLGWLSVDLFFVMSGFVIALSYERRLQSGLSFSGFMLARARRLLPVHLVAMGALTILLSGMAASHALGPISPGMVVTEAVFNSAFIPDPISPVAHDFARVHSPFPLNPAEWSLWDEWAVNIMYAMFLFGTRTRLLAVVAMSSGAVLLWAVLGTSDGWSVGEQLGNFQLGPVRALVGFIIGIVICRLYREGALRRFPELRPELVYLAWLTICAIEPPGNGPVYQGFVAIVIAPLIVVLLVRSQRKMSPLWNRMGALSYPLYASHFAALMFASLVLDRTGLPSGLWRVGPMIAVALVLAEIVRRLSQARKRSLGPALSR